jgi:hypothetical protein
MPQIGGHLRHACECVIEKATERVATKDMTAFEEIGEDLGVVGDGALKVHPVGRNLTR